MNHTPTPWGIERTEDANWIGPLREGSHKIKHIIAHTDRGDLKPEYVALNDANADFVVRAVNFYDGLRLALEIISTYPLHSEPMAVALTMQEIAVAALNQFNPQQE